MTDRIMVYGGTAVIRAGDSSPVGFYVPGQLYAVWDASNRVLGAYLGHNAALGLPEFRPLIWQGPEAEPLRHVCAGRRAWVRRMEWGRPSASLRMQVERHY